MSYNGSGTFNINTAGQPVVTGTVISSTAFNALTADLGTGLSTAITKNGQTTVTANIPFNGYKLTGIAVATASGDALSYGQAATVSALTDSALTSGRVPYASTAGLFVDSANLTFNGTTLTANTLSLTNALATTSGGTGLTSFTSGGVVYASSTSALATGSALTFDGASLYVGGTTSAFGGTQKGFAAESGTVIAVLNGESANSVGSVGTVSNHDFTFKVNGSEQMRLNSTGLGIGATSPATGGGGGLTLGTTSSGKSFHVYSSSYANNGLGNFYGTDGNMKLQMGASSASSAYIFANTGCSLVLYSGGNTSATLDSAGNLGLGVTPSAWGTSYRALEFGNSSNQGALFTFLGNAQTWLGSNVYVNSTPAYTYAKTAGAGLYQIQGVSGGVHAWFTAPSGTAGTTISFTQAMTLDNSGNLLVGTTTSGYANSNSIVLLAPNGYGIVNHPSGASSGSLYLAFGYNASPIGSISQSGTTAVLYNVTSDQRLKENIIDAPEFGSVIDSIKVRSFDWKTDNIHQRAGFIAQELVTVAPEAVHQPADPEEMMAVDYSKLVPMLVKEIQSLRARVAQLETKGV